MKDLLPNKPSELIRVALADLERIEKSPRYRINMSQWHMPNGKCSVCFAGAVMAQTLKVPASESRDPQEFPDKIEAKLNALNCFRTGDVIDGLEYLDIEIPDVFMRHMEDGAGTPYKLPARRMFVNEDAMFSYNALDTMSRKPSDRKQWKLHMLDIAAILEAEGL